MMGLDGRSEDIKLNPDEGFIPTTSAGTQIFPFFLKASRYWGSGGLWIELWILKTNI